MILKLLPIIIIFLIPFNLVYGQLETDTNYLLYKGNQFLTLGKYEDAFSFYDRVLEIDSNNVDALLTKGNTLQSLARYEESIQYFEKILNIDSNNQIALIKLHDALMRITDYKFDLIDGVLEITVHDSNGGLIAYQRATNILALNHEITEKLIEKWPVIKIESSDNQNLAVYQQEFVEVLDKDTIFGFHEIPFSEKIDLPLTSTWYYQIPVEKGDVVSYVYSIFIPVD